VIVAAAAAAIQAVLGGLVLVPAVATRVTHPATRVTLLAATRVTHPAAIRGTLLATRVTRPITRVTLPAVRVTLLPTRVTHPATRVTLPAVKVTLLGQRKPPLGGGQALTSRGHQHHHQYPRTLATLQLLVPHSCSCNKEQGDHHRSGAWIFLR
jgi:hypothetical protein